MVDYGSGQKAIVMGGKATWNVVLIDSDGWNASEDGWTWKMLIGSEALPTTSTVSITATSATITTGSNTNDTMTLVFDLTNANSDLLTGPRYYVEIEGVSVTAETYFPEAAGTFHVRSPYGGG